MFDAQADFLQESWPHYADHSDDLNSAKAMLVLQHSRLVDEELRNGPTTVSELAGACDLEAFRVQNVIDILEDDETIYPLDPDAATS